jgi:hypothetical protein
VNSSLVEFLDPVARVIGIGAGRDYPRSTAMSQASTFIPDRFRAGLAELLTAYDYAQDSQTDPWQFAVALAEVLSAGATLADIRWLVLRGFAEHARETTVPGDTRRIFRALSPTSFPPDLYLTLSADGAATIRSLLAGPTDPPQLNKGEPMLRGPSGDHPPPVCNDTPREVPLPLQPRHFSHPSQGASHGSQVARWEQPPAVDQPAAGGNSPMSRAAHSPLKPVWDPAHRELRYDGKLVKRFRVPALNQIAILDAFQEDGWPEFIDDPIPPAQGQDPKHRLNVTIKALNRHQISRLIRFHGNGDGLQVFWEAVEGAP